MKRLVLGSLTGLGLAILALAITPAPAKADSLIVTINLGGTYTYGTTVGTSTLDLMGAPGVLVQITDENSGGTIVANELFDGQLEANSGTFQSGNGTQATPYKYGGSTLASGNGVELIDDGNLGGLSTDPETGVSGVLLEGNVTGATFTMDGSTNATETFVITEINPSLLADLGLGGSNPYGGTLETAVITANQTLGSTSGTLTPVSETSSLGMLGIGMLGIALLALSRRSKVMVAA